MKTKATLLLALTLALCLALASAAAQEARDITASCAFSTPSRSTAKAHDGLYTTTWYSETMVKPWLEITVPEGESAEYLYVCFGRVPAAWAVEEKVDGKWRTLIEGPGNYAHVVLDLGGKTQFRIVGPGNARAQLRINEVFIFSAGDLPDWVQRWEPTVEKADLLLLVAHPDDELIFFGGTIPTYDVERGLDVVVAYMTAASDTRRSELLNGLWSLGVRNYPVIGSFGDSFSLSLKGMYEYWPKNRVQRYVMGLVRRYKPEVVVTHDVGGEYGHGAHRVCADAMRYCVENANDPSVQRESAQEYGTWQVKKLYLHLYEENEVTMDWRVPLEAFGGKTGLELAQDAFLLHVSQQDTVYEVTDEGETGNARFGLAYTTVGMDVLGGDFMENIP